jgi:hypothetical protein
MALMARTLLRSQALSHTALGRRCLSYLAPPAPPPPPSQAPPPNLRRITIPDVMARYHARASIHSIINKERKLKEYFYLFFICSGTPLVMVTAYDLFSGTVAHAAGADMILVGDSLANVMLGFEDTSQVTMCQQNILH